MTTGRTMMMGALLGALLWTGCGDDEAVPDASSGTVDAQAAADAPTSIDGAPTADADPTAPDALPVPDAVPTPDAVPCSTICPVTTGVTPPNASVYIESVRFGDPSQVVVRNISGDDLVFDSNWQLCTRPAYADWPAFTLAAGEAVTLHLGASGTDDADNLYFPAYPLLGASDEMAIYASTDYASSEDMQAFVRWGDAPSGFTRIDVAVAAGLWPSDTDFVEVCGTHTGVIATGDTTTPTGYDSADAACF